MVQFSPEIYLSWKKQLSVLLLMVYEITEIYYKRECYKINIYFKSDVIRLKTV